MTVCIQSIHSATHLYNQNALPCCYSLVVKMPHSVASKVLILSSLHRHLYVAMLLRPCSSLSTAKETEELQNWLNQLMQVPFKRIGINALSAGTDKHTIFPDKSNLSTCRLLLVQKCNLLLINKLKLTGPDACWEIHSFAMTATY